MDSAKVPGQMLLPVEPLSVVFAVLDNASVRSVPIVTVSAFVPADILWIQESLLTALSSARVPSVSFGSMSVILVVPGNSC